MCVFLSCYVNVLEISMNITYIRMFTKFSSSFNNGNVYFLNVRRQWWYASAGTCRRQCIPYILAWKMSKVKIELHPRGKSLIVEPTTISSINMAGAVSCQQMKSKQQNQSLLRILLHNILQSKIKWLAAAS